ncbi:unnamed protein product [Prunus armeniaca]|uniref:Uncharacterized protein n=1 Tax=Prunus armeniaca TaxID=36596 RepID=A0A6J5UIR3_PRUAR|nr:unnamed protein product [Prunus armeniaca]
MALVNKCPTKSPEALAHLPDTDMQLGEANSKLIVINKLITITITIMISQSSLTWQMHPLLDHMGITLVAFILSCGG